MSIHDRPQLDLTRRAWVHQRGDILVVGTWWMGERDEDVEPCLVLLPSHRRLAAPLPPVVTMSGAYLWTDALYTVEKARDFLDVLGMTENATNVMRIAEIVTDHIRDLFAMPPLPGAGSTVVADATMLDISSGKTLQAEITRLN